MTLGPVYFTASTECKVRVSCRGERVMVVNGSEVWYVPISTLIYFNTNSQCNVSISQNKP